MSTSSKEVKGKAGFLVREMCGSRRGFGLIEAMVALVVAGLLLPSLARALSGAWTTSRMPMDIVSGISLARNVAAGADVPADARHLGFDAQRRTIATTILILPSDVAPAPPGTGKDDAASKLQPDATPSAIRLAVPQGFGSPPAEAAPAVVLRRITVVVNTPRGRRMTLDGLRLDDVTP